MFQVPFFLPNYTFEQATWLFSPSLLLSLPNRNSSLNVITVRRHFEQEKHKAILTKTLA